MKITIYGTAHISGTSKKTGNLYDLTIVHTLMPARNTRGMAAKQIMLDATRYPESLIDVGAEYEIEFDNTGYPVVFQPAG